MFSISAFAAELQQESANTRKILERLPAGQVNWQPHEKSMSLVQLAAHIAEIPGMFIAQALQHEELDFAKTPYVTPPVDSPESLMVFFEDNLTRALKALEAAGEEQLNQIWTMRKGEIIFAALPRKVVIRNMGLNHLIHHRGQLSVYLRLLGIPVPGMYGPSADDIF